MRKGPRRSRPPGLQGSPGSLEEQGGFLAAQKRGPVRLRHFWLLLLLASLAASGMGLYLLLRAILEPQLIGQEEQMTGAQLKHKPQSLATEQLKGLVSRVSLVRLWNSFLQPMLIERYSGSPGNKKVRRFLVDQLKTLKAPWHIQLDAFEDEAPHGTVNFANVVATLDPDAAWRLVFACHYDSKYFPRGKQGQAFVGATDSAVPCAMLLELATALDELLLKSKEQGSKVTLQLLFLDGEEAFKDWTDSDSLYGARHLAKRMARTSHRPGVSQLQAITLFFLLDLLGEQQPIIRNHFSNTAAWFKRLISIEKRLHKVGLLTSHPTEQLYFHGENIYSPVEDDHVPFLRRGVPVLHFIATPFPAVWHTLEDTMENLHPPTIENLCKILTAFLAEYLWL